MSRIERTLSCDERFHALGNGRPSIHLEMVLLILLGNFYWGKTIFFVQPLSDTAAADK